MKVIIITTAMRKEFLKAKKVAHPNSRKSIAIAKRTRKITNRRKAKINGLIKQNLVGEKMLWIKEHMIPDICPYTPELTARLLETSISYKRNKQHASREDILRMTREKEQEEYDTCGIEIPDILNPTQCEMLRNWNGELRYMTNFKFRRFGKKHLNALKKANKESKENKDIQAKVSKKSQNSSEEVKFEEIENSLNKSIDSSENNQSIECIMEIE
ncbi:hypothetical protein APICC_08584 [Apis cerana cerana]|uniref:Translation machinery-associated protein n=1 Tax=Apis cerana cerana TaxID=94128 RepID=A0A2A3ECW7_APICC|nr:hypothetical protein APICC_08584 [Apis cerana cerana]